MITIIMGSKSDIKIAEKATKILKEFDVKYTVNVASAHRTPALVEKIVKSSESSVFIAIAGLAAHLPGVVASMTTKPVIAVPVESKLDGLDALLSAVQMPPGIPVACVGIDRGENAAILALQMLSISNEKIAEKLAEYRETQKNKVYDDNSEIQKLL
ncbi:5-(carboxyamino)imidazole ribonucleotide mutase [Methanococcus voltae]|uniref:N5-carboxyaminoimidazole ribonucleotide mutase n=2 Tax=Methanococcus voltae TaxID=2188 RepID=A0A8J7REB0_METVO|nr:5-(carboxyamino)imidazole ribonucleotide mutase [Methanococcus voltae]MBP2172435.1 5-(carboxyamino)imidazole ribonucleotide mutase [Methanococcus voltae]MBP2200609.1 5-(carboxyamino)imidazole ribonucleotide mutase [Methanococcus voltae]MCS3921334.1 5-(carboxyamino)imidazole ribonucleotide mutase [Methanococcus voltae PS]